MLATAADCGVLIVEDHEDTAQLVRWYLKRKGIEAEVARSGMEALEYLEQHRPCCLILDQMMPGMTGLELFRQILARHDLEDIPVLFYSALFDWRQQMEAEALGARGWFVKGVSRMSEMVDKVAQFCSPQSDDSHP